MSELIEELKKLPKNSTEFKDGLNVLMDNIDLLTNEEQKMFADLAEDFINEEVGERTKTK